MALTDKLTAIADAIRTKTGGTDPLTLVGMAEAIAGISSGGSSGGDGVTVTEYVVTENADRSLWLNEQGIKLVKGINLLISSKFFLQHGEFDKYTRSSHRYHAPVGWHIVHLKHGN